MPQSINIKTVLIESFPLEESTSPLQKSDTTREQEMKKQNRGTVIMVGGEVDWPTEGMVVSYLRNAATDFTDEDGKVYQIVNRAHVLAEFATVKKGK